MAARKIWLKTPLLNTDGIEDKSCRAAALKKKTTDRQLSQKKMPINKNIDRFGKNFRGPTVQYFACKPSRYPL